MTSKVVTILSVKQQRASFQFLVTFNDGTSALTKHGAQINFVIENSEYQGVPVEATFNDKRELVNVRVV